MFRKFTIALAFLALTGLMFAGCSNKKLVEQKDAQISALQDELGQLEGQLSDEKARTAKLQADLDNALADVRTKEQVIAISASFICSVIFPLSSKYNAISESA